MKPYLKWTVDQAYTIMMQPTKREKERTKISILFGIGLAMMGLELVEGEVKKCST